MHVVYIVGKFSRCHSNISIKNIMFKIFKMTRSIESIFFLSILLKQIDCHDSGTESDGDLDTEDFHDQNIELSKYFFLHFCGLFILLKQHKETTYNTYR